MLRIRVKGSEFFDESNEEFVTLPDQVLVLEHSLLSVSKWESKWKISFFNTKLKMNQFIDYIRCMTVNSQVNPMVYGLLTDKQLKRIKEYIDDSKTATTIRKRRRTTRNRNTTSELIYCWMFTLNIPIECEKWHLSRLLTLIDVCSIENDPKARKNMSMREIHSQNAAINAARRAKYHTRG